MPRHKRKKKNSNIYKKVNILRRKNFGTIYFIFSYNNVFLFFYSATNVLLFWVSASRLQIQKRKKKRVAGLKSLFQFFSEIKKKKWKKIFFCRAFVRGLNRYKVKIKPLFRKEKISIFVAYEERKQAHNGIKRFGKNTYRHA